MAQTAWIKAALAARGYSQRDVAKHLGKSEASVTRFLQGTENQDPKLSEAVQIAQLLGMPVDEMAARMGFRGKAATPPPLPGPTSSSGAPPIGTVSMVPGSRGLRVLLHLDLPAEVAAQVVALLGPQAQKTT